MTKRHDILTRNEKAKNSGEMDSARGPWAKSKAFLYLVDNQEYRGQRFISIFTAHFL